MPGDPSHPVTDDMLEAKFRDCVSFAAAPLSPQNIDAAIRYIRQLEDVTDVAEIMRLLSPQNMA